MPARQMAISTARYSFDSNVIINPWNRQYPRDVFPGFWRDIEELIENGLAICAEEVRREIEHKDDDINHWLTDRAHMIVPFDRGIEEAYIEVINKFRAYAKRTQARNQADPVVIALAMSRNLVVVTEEKREPGSASPKIPDVCDHFGVVCLSIVEMMRKEGWSY